MTLTHIFLYKDSLKNENENEPKNEDESIKEEKTKQAGAELCQAKHSLN